MSWNKNTQIMSELPAQVKTLVNLKVKHKITELGRVWGQGLNDSPDTKYPIRRLEYKNVVILEQMQRTSDCDMDDIIVSFTFTKKTEPKNWKIEISEKEAKE